MIGGCVFNSGIINSSVEVRNLRAQMHLINSSVPMLMTCISVKVLYQNSLHLTRVKQDPIIA